MQAIQQYSDAELINAFRNGNQSALEILINRYKDKIYTAIFMLVKDEFTADDIFQDAFLKMIKTIRKGKYAEQGKFLPWAMRVAHNLCMDHFRKVKHNVSVVLPDGTDITDILPASTYGASDAMERREAHSSVRKLVENLPEEQREVVVLRIYADLSFKDISELTGVSINTALGRMRYGLINLRKMIEEKNLVLR